MTADPRARIVMAREAARDLIDALEVTNTPVDRCLMIAQRLARLMRDTDAQTWLEFEERGYPKSTTREMLGSCAKYALRWYPDGTVYETSLPELEARARSSEVFLSKLHAPTITTPTANFSESRSTMDVVNNLHKVMIAARDGMTTTATNLVKSRSCLHRYAADTLLALEMGDAAETIFEAARIEVDTFLRAECPQAVEQIVAVNERMTSDDSESLSAALTSCRRVLKTVADVVFPPQTEPHIDGSGKPRNVNEEAVVNRLIAFLQISHGKSTRKIVTSELEYLAARLNAINDVACKGVHSDVTLPEARLLVIHTYLFLAEVARARASSKVADDNALTSTDIESQETPPVRKGRGAKKKAGG